MKDVHGKPKGVGDSLVSEGGGVCAGEALTPKVLVGFFTIKFRQLKRMRLKVAHAITEEKCGGLWKSARGATRRGQVEHRDSRRLGILKPRNRETTTHAGFKVHFHSGCMSSCTGKGVKRGACGKHASCLRPSYSHLASSHSNKWSFSLFSI